MFEVTFVVLQGAGGSIFYVWGLVFEPGVTILVIRGSPGAQKRTPRDPGLYFHPFLMDLGTLFGSVFYQVGFLVVVRATKFATPVPRLVS